MASHVTSFPSPLTTYPLRLKPGQEIVSVLQAFVKDNSLHGAFILSCVGSVTRVALRMADSVTIKNLEGPFEIVSLVGTLSDGGHLHGSFSDSEGEVIGGHIAGEAVVYTTAEIVIGDCTAVQFCREFCDQSGYLELVVKKK